MNLTGRKNEVIVTLQKDTYLLTVDNAHKVLHIQYNDKTTLSQVKKDIDSLIDQLGYIPTRITHKKVKQFKFK